MKVDVGIIGGTGIGDRLLARGGDSFEIGTKAGILNGRIVGVGSKLALLIGRHSAGHKVPPHLVNYKAMALGLQTLGIKYCLSTAAVGCLRPEWPLGTLVACSDFIDFTGRNQTLYSDQVVHTDFTFPFGNLGRKTILEAANDLGMMVQPNGVYLCANGPRYETPAEIRLYGQFGADIVGMTAATEAILMREAGIDYACLAIVTNLAAGLSPSPLSHEEVVAIMNLRSAEVLNLLEQAVSLLPS